MHKTFPNQTPATICPVARLAQPRRYFLEGRQLIVDERLVEHVYSISPRRNPHLHEAPRPAKAPPPALCHDRFVLWPRLGSRLEAWSKGLERCSLTGTSTDAAADGANAIALAAALVGPHNQAGRAGFDHAPATHVRPAIDRSSFGKPPPTTAATKRLPAHKPLP